MPRIPLREGRKEELGKVATSLCLSTGSTLFFFPFLLHGACQCQNQDCVTQMRRRFPPTRERNSPYQKTGLGGGGGGGGGGGAITGRAHIRSRKCAGQGPYMQHLL